MLTFEFQSRPAATLLVGLSEPFSVSISGLLIMACGRAGGGSRTRAGAVMTPMRQGERLIRRTGAPGGHLAARLDGAALRALRTAPSAHRHGSVISRRSVTMGRSWGGSVC